MRLRISQLLLFGISNSTKRVSIDTSSSKRNAQQQVLKGLAILFLEEREKGEERRKNR